MRRVVSLVLAGLIMTACSQTEEKAPESGGRFVRGTAKVVSVDHTLAQAVLEYQGKRVYGYWEKETVLAQKGSVRVDDPVKAPVGEYQVPVVRQEEFAAEPGDTIEFAGMWTGKDIWLRSVAKVK